MAALLRTDLGALEHGLALVRPASGTQSRGDESNESSASTSTTIRVTSSFRSTDWSRRSSTQPAKASCGDFSSTRLRDLGQRISSFARSQQKPLGQGVGHEQKAVARPPAAQRLVHAGRRSSSWPGREQSRRGRLPNSAERVSGKDCSSCSSRHVEQAAIADRHGPPPAARPFHGGRNDSPRNVAKAPRSRFSSAYQGSCRPSTSAAQVCRSGATQSSSIQGWPGSADEVLDQQPRPDAGKRRFRGAVGDGETAVATLPAKASS